MDRHFAKVQAGIILGQDMPAELSERACRLHACGTAAYQDDGKQCFSKDRVDDHIGLFQHLHELAPQIEGVRNGLQGKGVLFHVLVTKKVRFGTPCDDEVVIIKIAYRGGDRASLHVDGSHGQHPEMEVTIVLKSVPQRAGDAVGLQSGRAHLVEQGLKSVVVILVEKNYLVAFITQFLNSIHSPEPAADDDYALLERIGNVQCQSCCFFHAAMHTKGMPRLPDRCCHPGMKIR